MNLIKKNKALLILGILFLAALIFSKVYNDIINKEIDENRYITVGKVYKISKGGPNNASLHYKARYKGKVYFYSNPIESSRKGKKYLNKYFEVHLSTKNPKRSYIYLNMEVKDAGEISELGF